jgi:hypothetical protein
MNTILPISLAIGTLVLVSVPAIAGPRTDNGEGFLTTKERTVTPNGNNGYSGSTSVTRTNPGGGKVIIERQWQTDGRGNVDYEGIRTRTTRNGNTLNVNTSGSGSYEPK